MRADEGPLSLRRCSLLPIFPLLGLRPIAITIGFPMIASLRGTLAEKHPNRAIVDVGGVGYDVAIPVSTFSALADVGSTVALYIHTHVREDAIALFGFSTTQEKGLFEKLISVSGIGPSLAIKILSGLA